jgi:hypothetical protein
VCRLLFGEERWFGIGLAEVFIMLNELLRWRMIVMRTAWESA